MIRNFALQINRNWKQCPAKPALYLGMFGSVGIAMLIHDAFFSGSGRAAGDFIFVVHCDNGNHSYAHFLIYRRETLRSLRDELLSLGIAAAGFGAGIWISFAYLDDDSVLTDLPILVGLFVGWGVDFLIRKRFRKA